MEDRAAAAAGLSLYPFRLGMCLWRTCGQAVPLYTSSSMLVTVGTDGGKFRETFPREKNGHFQVNFPMEV